jgi:hypothetical protein
MNVTGHGGREPSVLLLRTRRDLPELPAVIELLNQILRRLGLCSGYFTLNTYGNANQDATHYAPDDPIPQSITSADFRTPYMQRTKCAKN